MVWFFYWCFWLISIPVNYSFKIGTWSLLSVVENVTSWFTLAVEIKRQFTDQVRIWLISQLINGISRALWKLPRYFNGTIILRYFVPLFPVLPVTFDLKLKDLLVLTTLNLTIPPLAFAAGSFYNIAINLQLFLDNYYNILLNYA